MNESWIPFFPFAAHMGISTMLVEGRSATMTNHESPGFLPRMLIALGHALRRGILGKSGHDYMKQFSGRDDYWDRVVAAQLDWPDEQPPEPDPNRIRSAGNAVAHAWPGVRRNAPCPPQPDYEPVHGWTKRQCDDYLARNPGYRSTYEVELQKRRSASFPDLTERPLIDSVSGGSNTIRPQATPSQMVQSTLVNRKPAVEHGG